MICIRSWTSQGAENEATIADRPVTDTDRFASRGGTLKHLFGETTVNSSHCQEPGVLTKSSGHDNGHETE